MEIHRAVSLGILHQQLGINRSARVSYKHNAEGVVIWDLETETEYIVDVDKVSRSKWAVPLEIRAVINASDDDLKQRLSESWMDGWSDERETIITELAFRGIRVPRR